MGRVYIKKHATSFGLRLKMPQSDRKAFREVWARLWYNLIYTSRIAEICREKFEGETYENI